MTNGEHKSKQVKIFHDRLLPETAQVVGYGELIDHYSLRVPLPRNLSAIALRHKPKNAPGWQLFSPKYAPDDSLEGHLVFALKWEGIDLSVLAALFKTVPAEKIARLVERKQTGAYARRVWFLFEWLTDRTLDVPIISKVTAVEVVDPRLQYALSKGEFSSRHKVRNNLPGTKDFCPMIYKTKKMQNYGAKNLRSIAKAIISGVPPDILTRAAAFLLLKDSKSSFQIEGETPSRDRTMRWGKAISEAGSRDLSIEELQRLQRIVIGDSRFVDLGFRTGGGFVGSHDRETREPIPDHISARAEDVANLTEGIIAFALRAKSADVDSVVTAAAVAFGFVFVHPFEDGNGRIHRWLIHHVLASSGFHPTGLVFPISTAILRNVYDYRSVLEEYSKPLLEFIKWKSTAEGNVEVINDTADYYRYFDATPHAEFLYRCVEETVEKDLPYETAYLSAYDNFKQDILKLVDMPDRTVDLLLRFLRQGNGRFSKRAEEREFAALTTDERLKIEAFYMECFGEVENLK